VDNDCESSNGINITPTVAALFDGVEVDMQYTSSPHYDTDGDGNLDYDISIALDANGNVVHRLASCVYRRILLIPAASCD